MSVVDNAIYIDGKRAVVPDSLDHRDPRTDPHLLLWKDVARTLLR